MLFHGGSEPSDRDSCYNPTVNAPHNARNAVTPLLLTSIQLPSAASHRTDACLPLISWSSTWKEHSGSRPSLYCGAGEGG